MPKPNIVVFILDAGRADHFTPYGYEQILLPFLNGLAEKATVYERAYANSIWSLPSYMSFFTGKYPFEHGSVDWDISGGRNNLVESLNDEYTTVAVTPHLLSGNYGLADTFDELEWVRVPWRDPPFEDEEFQSIINSGIEYDSTFQKISTVLNTAVTERSLGTIGDAVHHMYYRFRQKRGWWVDDGGKELFSIAGEKVREMNEPFFLFANPIEPHAPYRPPKRYVRRFIPEVPMAELNDVAKTAVTDLMLGRDSLSERERDLLISLYDAELAYTDDLIRDFYQDLEKAGVADNTLVVITSDHGDLFGERGIWGHQGRIHNRLCNVPLLIDYPWQGGHRESGIIDHRQLGTFLSEIPQTADQKPTLDTVDEVFVEYYGLDTQKHFKPWEKYEGVSMEWGNYQVARLSESYLLYWDAGGGGETIRYNGRSRYGGGHSNR